MGTGSLAAMMLAALVVYHLAVVTPVKAQYFFLDTTPQPFLDQNGRRLFVRLNVINEMCNEGLPEDAEFFLACPSSHELFITGELHCVSYRGLCNIHRDCPDGEDEDPTFCLFHRMMEDNQTLEVTKLRTKANRIYEELQLLEEFAANLKGGDDDIRYGDEDEGKY